MGKKPLGPQLEAARVEIRALSSQLDKAEKEAGKLANQIDITAATLKTRDDKIEILEKAKELLEEIRRKNVELSVENRLLREDREDLRNRLQGG